MKNIILLVSFICFGFTVNAQQSKISQEVKDHIKARVDTGINVAIVVGLIDGDDVEYYSYGKTTLENGTEVDEFSVFEIGSISKTFTTIIVADEILKGKMSLSDPISKYFPEQVKVPTRNGQVITIKDVATHSSGLPRMPDNFTPANPNNPYADYTIELSYEFMSSSELTRDIGEKYEYSNFGMGMLGHILELQYDKSFEEIMVERIATPYGMDNTRVVFTESMKAHLAYGHANGSQVENWDIPALAGAGAIRSTATDMVKYLKANMGVTKGPLYEAMKMTHEVAYSNDAQDFKIGLAWHYADDGKIVWHNGGTGGYVSFAGFIKGTTKGVVVLTNTAENINGIGFKLLNDSNKLILPKMSIANALEQEINANGLEKGLAFYRKAKTEQADTYNFEAGELNRLGYSYMNLDNIETALAIFKLNVEMHPKASNPYDSLGEAYLKKGDSALAIINYTKTIELNPANENAIKILADLGVNTSSLVKEIILSEAELELYIGTYQLMPEFSITITRDGNKLFGQASGQPPFELFAKSEHVFYLKAVQATVDFNLDANGSVESLTLHQGGQDILGKKIK